MFLLQIQKKYVKNLSKYLKWKQYIKFLIIKNFILNEIKNKKSLSVFLIKELIQKNKLIKQFYYLKYFKNNFNIANIKIASHFSSNFKLLLKKKKQNLIVYIINICLTSTNTLVNITDFKGNSKIYCSSGYLNLKKKQKTKQPLAIINLLKILITKTKFLKNKPIAIHFTNIKNYYERFIIKLLKNKFFIKNIKSYRLQPHNGCKPKKIKRFKKKTIKGMTEWFKVADCKSVGYYSIVGSNPASFKYRNITQFW